MATDQALLKKQILDFSRDEEQDNKRCFDCQSPHPQWASANNAIFLCIQCAGVHRGFGVHISFVRSVTMDTWKQEEVAKMKLGGNKAFREFLRSYTPVDAGGYREGIGAHELYHSWVATQWREKLAKELVSETFSPSLPPDSFGRPSRPVSSQSVRKTRQTRTREASSLRSASPASMNATTTSLNGSPVPPENDQKSANENFFAGLGSLNASRPDNLPPSQGGRYTGFGSSPSPPPPSTDSMALSSQNLPSFQDMQSNPLGSLSKGWSLFSTAVVGAGKAMNENILQPGMERVRQETPGMQQRVGYLMGEAGKRLTEASSAVRDKTGVDIQESFGNLVDKVKGPAGGRKGYEAVDPGWGEEHAGETSALYGEGGGHDGDDFFAQYSQGDKRDSKPAPAEPVRHVEVEKEGWDDWKDF